ncbi:MAG: putative Response regulator/sensory box histidine kinase [Verrucomicrobiales bacterium]|nr:putative Response regulator/sensory box histidine kinase [Verrucomicrobiales bacterium]
MEQWMRWTTGVTGVLAVLAGGIGFPTQSGRIVFGLGAPLHYDFALGLILAGAAFAAFAAQRFIVVRLVSGLILLLGIAGTLHSCGFFPSVGPGIGSGATFTANFEHPIGLILLGVAFFSLSAGSENKRRPALIAVLGSILLALSLTAIATTWLLPVRSGTTGLAGVTLNGGLLLLGFGLLTISALEGYCPKHIAPIWLPFPVAAGLVTGTMALWEGHLQLAPFPMPQVSLAAGLLLSVLLPSMTYFAQNSNRRAVECEDALSKLDREVQERKKIEEDLRTTELFNRQIIECNNDCVAILDAAGQTLFVNQRGLTLMEAESEGAIVGRSWLEGFDPGDYEALEASLKSAALGKTRNLRVYRATSKGTPKWWDIILAPLQVTDQGPRRLLVISRDVTEHMQVEKALRESEEAFRKIFEEGPMAMILAGVDSRVTKVNNAFCRMLGYMEDELTGFPLTEITHPDDVDEDVQLIDRLIGGEIPSFSLEKRYLTKRREVVWGHVTASLIRDPESRPVYLVAMIESINERKQTETKVLAYQEQLQSLASKLSLSEERERRRIATNLHDRIGQSLAFAILKLSALSQQEITDTQKESIREIRQLIEDAMGDTRSLTFELSPPVLYELGLVPAVEWLARKIQQDHGIETRFHDDGQPKPLDEDFRIVLFQAVRELLVNVVKHARASHAQVLVRRDGDALRVIIEDDGVGFDPAAKQSWSEGSAGFGLFSTRERLDYLGGQVKIRSNPGEGTRITLLAPLKLDDDTETDI